MSVEREDRVVNSLRDLPGEASPARDLWPDIQSRLAPRSRRWVLPLSMAAGLLVVAMGVIIGMQVRALHGPDLQPASSAFMRAALLNDAGYLQRRDALRQELPAKLERLPADSRQRVLESLAAIQDAIRVLEAELGRDAGNAVLQELFITTCQEEMRVLTAIDAIGDADQEI